MDHCQDHLGTIGFFKGNGPEYLWFHFFKTQYVGVAS